MSANTSDLGLGRAGEYLVCADLILKGYQAFPSAQGVSFDLIIGMQDRLYKVQVKTTARPIPIPQRVKQQTPKYCFNVRRCGKGGRRSYKKGEIDIFALVATDSKTIGYLSWSQVKQTMFFLPEDAERLKNRHGMKSRVKKLSSYTIDDCIKKVQKSA